MAPASKAFARSSKLYRKAGAGLKGTCKAYRRAGDSTLATEVRRRAASSYVHARTAANDEASMRRGAMSLARNADNLEAGRPSGRRAEGGGESGWDSTWMRCRRSGRICGRREAGAHGVDRNGGTRGGGGAGGGGRLRRRPCDRRRTRQRRRRSAGTAAPTCKGPRRRGERPWRLPAGHMRARRECGHSNMVWRTGIVQLPGGRWPVAYWGDDSRRIAAFRVVMGAAAANATAALHEGMARHGRPASIMTDHGSRFLANEAEGPGAGRRPSRPGPGARARGTSWPGSPIPGRTAGSRFHRTVRRRPGEFEAESSRTATLSGLPGWHFRGRAVPPRRPAGRHAAWRSGTAASGAACRLARAGAPAMAYARRMPPGA